jgi:3-carboxy-cis,cis-muconate cycloisomerase
MQAHHLVEDACRRAVASGQHLRDVLMQDAAITAELNPEHIDKLLDPANYLGQARVFGERVLQTWRRRRGRR